jgi:hypothetical protein
MPVCHINLKQPDIDRLKRLTVQLSLTRPGIVAMALRALEEKEAARNKELAGSV